MSRKKAPAPEPEEEPSGPAITEAVEAALRDLAAQGDLTPRRVVEEAHDKDSPLHGFFTWDDAAAAHAHRLEQARALIRRVRVEVTVQEHVFRVPAYVHDPRRDEEGGYVETTRVQSDRDLAIRVVRQEVSRALSALDRAKRVAGALGLVAELEVLIERGNAVRAALDAYDAAAE